MSDTGSGPGQPDWGQPPAGYQQGYGQPMQPGYPPQGYYVAPTTSTKAVFVLVLGIASFAICPVVPAIIALVMAPQAEAEIAGSGGRIGGDGLVKAGRIISWIHLGLCGLFLLFFLLVVLGGAMASSG